MTSPTLATRTLLLLALIGAPLAIACTGPELGATETDQETGGSGIFIGSSSASEGGDQSAEAPDQCDLKAFDCPHRVNRPVMFVIDNSYSMRSERIGMWDDDGDDRDDDGWVDGAAAQQATPRVTRWSSLHDELALMGALFEDRLEMGMTLFPAFDPTAEAAPLCAVGATPEIPFGADWWEAMSGRKIPYRSDSVAGGAAPAAAAIDAALAALADREAEVPGAIVLVTDGAATCGSEPGAHDERLLEVVTAAKDRGVPTFVVGIDIPAGIVTPISEHLPDGVAAVDIRAALSGLAEAGGTARPGEVKYFAAHDKLALSESLAVIVQELTSCLVEFAVSIDEDAYTLASLQIATNDGQSHVYGPHAVADCETESGWRFGADRSRIELCGDACTQYQSGGSLYASVECVER